MPPWGKLELEWNQHVPQVVLKSTYCCGLIRIKCKWIYNGQSWMAKYYFVYEYLNSEPNIGNFLPNIAIYTMAIKQAYSPFCCDPHHCRPPPTLPSQLLSSVCARRCGKRGTRIRYSMICSMNIKQNMTN